MSTQTKHSTTDSTDLENIYSVVRNNVCNASCCNADTVAIDVRDGDNGAEVIIEHDGEGMTREELRKALQYNRDGKVDPLAGAEGVYITTPTGNKTLHGESTRDNTSITDRDRQPWDKGTRLEIRGIDAPDDFLSKIDEDVLRHRAAIHISEWDATVTIHTDDP